MFRNVWIMVAWITVTLGATATASAQERRSRIDVEHYVINAEINENTQTLAARTAVRFVPLEDNVTSATFELNNALNVSKVMDEQNRQIPASRSQDFNVHLNFNEPLQKGKPVTGLMA